MSIIIVDETYFSPDDDCESEIIGVLQDTFKSVHVNAYGFSSPKIMDMLILLHNRGIGVHCLCDHTQAEGPAEKAQLQRLVDAGIEVVVTTSRTGAIDHEKVIIVDGDAGALDSASTVIFGSYNFSLSAEKQDNYISVRNDASLVDHFMSNWNEIYQQPHNPDWQVKPSGT